LAEDHRRAATLAAGLAERGWQVNTPQTNIVLLTPADLPSVLLRLEKAELKVGPMGGAVRFVTHSGLTDADIKDVLDRTGSVDD
ncbi:MAG TPA: low specificity L-threonine aldolase, partial [Pseudonocardia sp.]